MSGGGFVDSVLVAGSKASLSLITETLARGFVLGEIEEEAMVKRVSKAYFDGKKPRCLRPVARHIEMVFGSLSVRANVMDVSSQMMLCRSYTSTWEKRQLYLGPVRVPIADKMIPGKGAPSKWKIPAVVNLMELTKLLELHIDDLGWLSSQSTQTDYYHFKWHAKRGV